MAHYYREVKCVVSRAFVIYKEENNNMHFVTLIYMPPRIDCTQTRFISNADTLSPGSDKNL